MIDAVIAKLKATQLNGKPLFNRVEEAIDLSNSMTGRLKPSPVAFVIEINRRPGNNARIMGKALQEVTTTIGVVVGISKTNDPQGTKAKADVAPILTATRKALFGFIPTTEHTTLLLAAADTVGVTEHALWQLERFTTTHLEEATHG